jgi:DNA-directed RNA polymerase subunit RPC12/RpoP
MNYKCPICKSKDLVLTEALVVSEVPLEDDGFDLYGVDTTDEKVRCRNCGHEADMSLFEE